MSNKGQEEAIQAVIIADTFNNEFLPISNSIPLALFPVINRPLIDYTLEFLSLGGITETFLFCCSHIEAIKAFISKSIEDSVVWTFSMKVNVIVSESCRSFGDCLRDIDAKGLLRGNFVLVDAGTVANIKLLPLLKKHSKTIQQDQGAAMTLIFQESATSHLTRHSHNIVIANDEKNRVLYHKKLDKTEKKINFPLEIFTNNSCVSLLHNLKDTHIAICSSSVLPLFSDNFDFQTTDDFIKGIMMNEDVLGVTIYCHLLEGDEYGGAISNWRTYHFISLEMKNRWVYPLVPPQKKNWFLKNDVISGKKFTFPPDSIIKHTIIDENTTIGKNCDIEESIIFANCKISNNVIISNSIIGPNCLIKSKTKVSFCIFGNGVVLDDGKILEDCLVEANKPENYEFEKLGKKAYKYQINGDTDCNIESVAHQLNVTDLDNSDEESDAFQYSEDDNLSHTQSPLPDDTKLFFTEVIDSVTRGFEDELFCDNLILEINSSRYAYNVTLKEVNFNVVKAILHMSLRFSIGQQYFSQFVRLLSYCAPILKNYIRNKSAMLDSLQAIEEVAICNENVTEKWVMFVLKWFYDKDHLSEDVILEWFSGLDKKTKFYKQVQPFADWLQEAEEASSSEGDE